MKTHANPDVLENCQRPQAPSSATGWAIRGQRWNVEKELMEYFRSPPEPHTYCEETARHMLEVMSAIHTELKWEIISPNNHSAQTR